MTTAAFEKLTWVLIFGGLGLLSLGIFVERMDTTFGWSLAAVGALAAAVGVVLVWWRSRAKE